MRLLLPALLLIASPSLLAEPRTKPVAVTPDEALGVLQPGLGLTPGSLVPDVEVRDEEGRPVTLAGLWKERPRFVVFYRGGWCPFCNTQLRELTKRYGELQASGVDVVAISVDRPDEATKSKAAWTIPFPVLSDSTLAAHEAFQVVQAVGDAEVLVLKGLGMDLEQASGQQHHRIAVPAVFLVRPGGRIAWVHASRDYKTRPSVDQLLRLLGTTKPAPGPAKP